jgi:hypothetical protein
MAVHAGTTNREVRERIQRPGIVFKRPRSAFSYDSCLFNRINCWLKILTLLIAGFTEVLRF